jgi:GTP-binding protein
MIIKNADLETVIGVTSKVPVNTLPEFAFAGRSNVGKSSLINAMLNRKKLARVSGKPGKTQTINYYNVNKELYLVDLPGYGYTRAAVEVKAEWGKMVERYLHSSKTLKQVFLLADCRHEPSDDDKMMHSWIKNNGFEPVIIATKIDKLKRSQMAKQMNMIKTAFDIDDELLIPFSSETKAGVNELWDKITSYEA